MLAFTVRNSMLDTSGTTILIASAKVHPINVLEFKTMISRMMIMMSNPAMLTIVVGLRAEGVTEVERKTEVRAEKRKIEVRALKKEKIRNLNVK